MMSLKFVVIKLLGVLHFSIVMFVIFGFLSLNPHLLLAHLIFLPILLLHWRTNQGVCYLTQIENKIQAKPIQKTEMQGGFTEMLYTKIFGKRPSRARLQIITYIIMSMSWMISLIKYINLSSKV